MAWHDKTYQGPLLADKLIPGRVVQSDPDRAAGATVWRLANGVRVVVKPTPFQNDWIMLDGSQPGGSSLVSDRDFVQARFAAEILRSSGVGDLSQLKIARLLTGKDVQVDVDLADFYQTVSAATRPEDLETMLQLLHLRLLRPRRSPGGFDIWKARRLEAERRRHDSPDERMNDEGFIVLYGNHPRRRPVTTEAIQAVNLDRVFGVWKERFADFNGFTFVFVGTIDPVVLRPLVETYLGSLPSRGRTERWKDPGFTYPSATIERSVTAGREPRSWFWLCFTAPERWTVEAEQDARILETVLRIRIADVLRRDASGVYEENTDVDLQREPTGRHFLTVTFACAPENVNPLRDVVLAELAEIASNGIGREYLAKAAAQIRKKHEVDIKDNDWWLNQLRDAYRHGDDFARVLDIETMLGRVTSDRLRATPARMVRGKPHIAISLLPAASP